MSEGLRDSMPHGEAARTAGAPDKKRLLDRFKFWLRKWSTEHPARAGEIRTKVCNARGLSEAEFNAWVWPEGYATGAAAVTAETKRPAEKKTAGAKTADGDDGDGKRPNYRELALRFLHEGSFGEPGDECKLIYYQEDFYTYTGTHFKKRSMAEFRAIVARFLLGCVVSQARVSNNLIGNVVQNLIGLCVLEGAWIAPCWRDKEPKRLENVITCENGLIDLDALIASVDDYAPQSLSSRFFCTSALPLKFDVNAECPKWRAMMKRIVPDDVADLLQRLGGYSLTLSTDFQVFIILHGDGCNGKSAFLAGLRAGLGPTNYSSLPMEVLQSEKTSLLEPLRGKRANIIEECGEVSKLSESLLKILTGGGSIDIDRKFREAIELVGSAKWWVASNEKPHFNDRTKGTFRRLIIIPFREEIAEAERIPGMDKPEFWEQSGELAGIFNWFVDGLRKLRQEGRIVLPKVCEVEREQYKREVQPERRFLLDGYQISQYAATNSKTIYDSYCEFLKDEGLTGKMSKQRFGRQITRVFPGVKSIVKGGARHWEGIESRGVVPDDEADGAGGSMQ